MIQQFRPGSYIKKDVPYPLEIVAGLVNKNDIIENTIIREVREEVNCKVLKIIKIGVFFPEISFSTREIHLFCGKFDSSKIDNYGDLKKENEEIKILLFSKEEILSKLKTNEIINSHSIIALQWFFLNIDIIEKEFSICL
jgi:ADP-ribose pyrophosphatase